MGYCPTRSRSVVNRTAIPAALILFAFGSYAENPEKLTRAEILVSRSPVELPLFHEIAERPLINFYTSEDDYAQARTDSRYEFERLTYLSDGLEVVALLYRRPTSQVLNRPLSSTGVATYAMMPHLNTSRHFIASQNLAIQF
jgi:hypothetical protein